MYKVVYSNDLNLEDFDPLIRDYMGIMKIYDKGIIILDCDRNKIHLNDISSKIFNVQVNLDELINFVSKLKKKTFFGKSKDRKKYEIYEKNKLKLKVLYRFIREKNK